VEGSGTTGGARGASGRSEAGNGADSGATGRVSGAVGRSEAGTGARAGEVTNVDN